MKKQENILNIIFALNIFVMCISAYFTVSGVIFMMGHKKTSAPPTATQVREAAPAAKPAEQPAPPPAPAMAEKAAPPAAAEKPSPEPAKEPVKTPEKPQPVKPQPPLAKAAPKKPAFKINSATYMLDDFNSGAANNGLDFETGSVSKYGGTIKYFVYKSNLSEDAGRESSLKMIFNVAGTPKAYVSYFSKMENVDISRYKRIAFDVKGSDGGETFMVSVDDGEKVAKMMLFASRQWRKVVVPFAGLNKKVNLKYFDGGIAIMVENKTANLKEGSIYIDNLTLE
ncbi:MAG: hypothetical protein A2297_10160 [Elusimicrobia bacterium RIFOXYB2_FULL_48_7]|nr:MAG: hypothetical protein A2297_10160 [Elusimicrobia bacterium RIFOXYB2_FULL_48_7]